MGNFIQLSPIETITAYFFAVTAIATLILTSWSYVYQKRRENMKSILPKDENYGEFFVKR